MEKNKRRSKEEGHLAQLIRRKMIQRDHGNNKLYKREKLNSKIQNHE
jgi:hypothetical protein